MSPQDCRRTWLNGGAGEGGVTIIIVGWRALDSSVLFKNAAQTETSNTRYLRALIYLRALQKPKNQTPLTTLKPNLTNPKTLNRKFVKPCSELFDLHVLLGG